jgi:formate dehydrogenase subunit gamma
MNETTETADSIRALARDCLGLDGPVMEALVRINQRFGYVPPEAQAIVADVLNVSQADVAGVTGFYSDFRKAPPGRVVVQLCRAEACQAAGVEAVVKDVEAALGCAFGETRSDGAVTLEDAYCFGNCALSPAAMIDGRLVGRVDAQAISDAVKP